MGIHERREIEKKKKRDPCDDERDSEVKSNKVMFYLF